MSGPVGVSGDNQIISVPDGTAVVVSTLLIAGTLGTLICRQRKADVQYMHIHSLVGSYLLFVQRLSTAIITDKRPFGVWDIRSPTTSGYNFDWQSDCCLQRTGKRGSGARCHSLGSERGPRDEPCHA